MSYFPFDDGIRGTHLEIDKRKELPKNAHMKADL